MKDLIGKRVQLSPHLDRWMMGDRYGEIVRIGRNETVWVKLDRSGQTKRFRLSDLGEVFSSSGSAGDRRRVKRRRDPQHRGNADLIRWYLRHAHEADRQLFGPLDRERRQTARSVTARNVRKLRIASRSQALGFARRLGYRG